MTTIEGNVTSDVATTWWMWGFWRW